MWHAWSTSVCKSQLHQVDSSQSTLLSTTNKTGRHWAKASGWLQSAITTMHVLSICPTLMLRKFYFSSSSVVLCAFSAYAHDMCIFDVRASSSPQATLVPNFVSVAPAIAELAHREKLHTQSLTQSLTLNDPAYLTCRERSFRFGTSSFVMWSVYRIFVDFW